MRAVRRRGNLKHVQALQYQWFSALPAAEARSSEEEVLDDLDHLGIAARLRECWNSKCFSEVTRIHDHIIRIGREDSRHLANLLVVAYGKCNKVELAREVFRKISDPNVFSWTVLIAAYAQNGHYIEALGLFRVMHLEGVEANEVTFITVLGACSLLSESRQAGLGLHEGRQAHGCITGSVYESYPVLQTALLDMYGKHGQITEARQVFEKMTEKDVVSWSAMVAAYAQGGQGREAIRMYRRMCLHGVKPNEITFVALSEACCSFSSSLERQGLYQQIVSTGLDMQTIVGNSLVSMFGKCGDPMLASEAFKKILEKDIVSWSSIISAFSFKQNEYGSEGGLFFFRLMLLEGIAPNQPTIVGCLEACTKLTYGRLVHFVAESMGMLTSTVIATAVLNMYSRCGSIIESTEIFDRIPYPARDVVAWTAMISGYQQAGVSDKVMILFRLMDLDGVCPNEVTFVSALLACHSASEAKILHQSIAGSHMESDVSVGTNLISFYAKLGCVQDAVSVFDKMLERTTATWNMLLGCYEFFGERMKVFFKMELEGVRHDETTFVRLMETGSLCIRECRMIHTRITAQGLESSTVLSNLLVSVYGECGSLDDAKMMFEKTPERNLISWTAIVTAYAQHGHSSESLAFYQGMHLEGIRPDEVTFITILFACSHAGLLYEGFMYFMSMVGEHGIACSTRHYDCLVDLLGRAGWLEEAEELVQLVPDSTVAWTSLLAACKTHNDQLRAERAGKCVAELDPCNHAHYGSLLFDICSQTIQP